MTMTPTERIEAKLLARFPRMPGVVPAIYRPKTGGEVPTYAQMEKRQISSGNGARVESADIRVPIPDVPDPAIDDTIEISGLIWTYRPEPLSTSQRGGGEPGEPFWLLSCRRDLRPTLAGGGR